jgi:uncharacterized protein (TIGR00369 family)
VVVTVTPGEQHCNLIGVVHGGLVATLADTAMGLAFQSCAEQGERCTTMNLNVTLIAAVRAGGEPVRAEGRVLHRGRRTLAAQATVADASGRLLATASATAVRVPA